MQPVKLMDYHLHTAVTIDGRMSEISACEQALSMGITEIAFTNHVMLTQPNYTMSPAALVDHWKNIQACRLRYPELSIRIGIEMDYYPKLESEITATLDNYAQLIGGTFDFIMGSIHDINGGFFSNKSLAPGIFKDRDITVLYQEFFDLEIQAVRSRLFDVIAHPDLIKKYSNQLTPSVSYDRYRTYTGQFIDSLIDCQVGIEVNTKGLKLPVNEVYPSEPFLYDYLSKTKENSVTPIVTVGSDAHTVEDVGFKIHETIENLHHLGLTALTRFEKRIKSRILI